MDTVSLAAGSGGRWFYAGYIEVTAGDAASCVGPYRRLQKTVNAFCYSWQRIGAVVGNPLDAVSANCP